MNKLSTDTARLISSLQVITKVENVVKELVENALDAGASCVEVKFEDYGLSKIDVRDNGSGIRHSDIEYAAQRHYTSKISCKEDLMSLHSYGFRGEALSSLCEVAEVFITTRTKDDRFSTKYSLNHKGVIIATKPCHLVQGTSILANNLFAKMPVRCQFYRTPRKKKQIMKNTEDILMSFALIHPEKRFSFLHNKSVIWQKPGCKDLRSSLETVLGSGIVSQMVKVEHFNEENQIQLCCYIPTTQSTKHFRNTNDRCFIYVNERPVRDKEIEKAIKQHTKLTNSSNLSAKWPVAFLSIQIPLDQVDSNVEADKSCVMISAKETLLTAVNQMLSEAYQSLPKDAEMEKENRGEDHHDIAQDVGDHGLKDSANENLNHCPGQNGRNDPLRPAATQWSKGQVAKDDNGQPVQPVMILAGHHGRPIPEFVRRSSPPQKLVPDRNEDGSTHGGAANKPSLEDSIDLDQLFNPEFEENRSFSSTLSEPHEKNHKLKQSLLNISQVTTKQSLLRPPARHNTDIRPNTPRNIRPSTPSSTSSKSSAKKRKASTDVHHATLITNWSSETKRKTTASPSLSEVSEENAHYAEDQMIDLKFDFAEIKEKLFYKEDYMYAERPPYLIVGVLKDVKGGVILDGAKRELFLGNLLRLQETKLFWSLMKNHAIHTRELPNSIFVSISSLTVEEKNGLKRLSHSIPDLVKPDIEYTDVRISKNGFKVKFVQGQEPDGSESLEVFAMTNAISYYNVDDLKWIFRKIGSSELELSLTETRPFKAVQFLQAEAVRMSYSLPVHSSVLEDLDDLKQHLSEDFEHWNCFHNKPIFQSVHCFSKNC